MFEESFKMPFAIRWPGVIKAGSTTRALIQNIDYGPTFLDVCGAKTPSDMQGRSIVPLLRNGGKKPADWRDAVYYTYYGEARTGWPPTTACEPSATPSSTFRNTRNGSSSTTRRTHSR